MKKLIGILNTFVLLSSATTSVVSCFEEDDKKSNKKHKNDEKDNEENNDNNNEATSQSLEFIIEQIKKLITIANVKANDTNTIFELTNEVKTRISKIIQDKPVNFELTIDQANEVKLEEKSYQYTIDLKHIASQDDEEASNSLTDTFSIVVKNEEVDLEKQQAMKQLEQLAQEIEKQLSTKTIIADGINTYKTEKEKIETELKSLALNKDIILQIDFINSVFKTDDEIIYQVENPFELKVDLFWKENNQFSLSKVYKIASASGITKEFLENMKNKDSQYDSIREVIKNLFADENFTNKITSLVNVKANGENTVKDVIGALNKLTNADVFGEKEEISKYYFKYAANSDANKKIVANENIAVDVAVFDQQEASPFFTTNFDLKILGESDLEKYERILAKIEKHLNNKEFDLSNFKELNADGKIQWNQTLSQIIKPDKLYDYFNFNILGSDFKSEYADLVDFDLKLDPEKINDLDNNYFTYNSEQHYVSLKLKVFKKGTSDANFKEKNVDLKIKVGGLTDQQIYQKQEEARIKFEKVLENRVSDRTTFIKFMAVNRDFNSWKWESALDFLSNNLNVFWDFDKSKILLEEITDYLDIKISKEGIENRIDIIKEKDETFLTSVWANIKLNVTVSPKGKKSWVNDEKHIYSFDYYTNDKWHLSDFSNIFYDTLADNEALFTTTNLKPGNDAEGNPIKLKALEDEIKEKIRKLISQIPTLSEMFKFLTTWLDAGDDKDNIDNETSLKKTDYVIRGRIGWKWGNGTNTKNLFTVKIT